MSNRRIRRTRRIQKNLNQMNDFCWQYPVITEKKFSERYNSDSKYLDMPWATIIDRRIDFGKLGIPKDKPEITCCQHIYFRQIIPFIKKLGVKTLYTPHKKIGEDEINGIKIKSCPLYAVNFEDSERNQSFQGVDFLTNERIYLYSFRGGINGKYLTNIRKQIFDLPTKENTIIENSGGWHFESAVYGQKQTHEGKYTKGNDIDHYNQMLIHSRYSLCPSGTGPNSIRFWESLACGAIPVLLSDTLDLPKGVEWDDAIIRVKESNIGRIDLILKGIGKEEESRRRKKCLEFYKKFSSFIIEELEVEKEETKEKEKVESEETKYDVIVSYCCGTYQRGDYGGVARYDYQLSKIFKNRVFFQGPKEKDKMLQFLKKYKKPLIITDNHLSCDIPNTYDIFLVHHGCALTHAEREKNWDPYWKNMCCNGQKKMFDIRSPDNTFIISTSKFCSDEFTRFFKEKYTKFKRTLIYHTSELEEGKYKKKFNNNPVVLGNWSSENKGKNLVKELKKNMKNFNFEKLKVTCIGKNFNDFNTRKQNIYLKSDIFLQISLCEGNSYATLDAMISGLVIVASNVGLFYKDVPENCFVKLNWEKNGDVEYVREKILEAWERKEELSKNCRQWYLDNCRFIDWEKKMKEIIN